MLLAVVSHNFSLHFVEFCIAGLVELIVGSALTGFWLINWQTGLTSFVAVFCYQTEKDDRHSDPNLEEKLQQTAKALNEEKRKSARRKEYDQFCSDIRFCYMN